MSRLSITDSWTSSTVLRCRKTVPTPPPSPKGSVFNHQNISIICFFFNFFINRLNELRENGLFDFWDLWFRPMPRQCAANLKGKAEKESEYHGLRRLSLKNLTGAFVVLSIGIGLSLLAFVNEHIFHLKLKRNDQRSIWDRKQSQTWWIKLIDVLCLFLFKIQFVYWYTNCTKQTKLICMSSLGWISYL